MGARLVVDLREVSRGDGALVGGKSSSLGELINNLAPLGVRIPPGFAVTTDGYRCFLEESGAGEQIRELVRQIDHTSLPDLQRSARTLRALITSAPFPAGLEAEIVAAYNRLAGGGEVDVAVRSSASAEDGAAASFAGQHDTFLNVRGAAAVIERVRECFASLFTERAISYRARLGFDHLSEALGVAVQRMVRSDLGASGVMFTLEPESGSRNVVFISSAWGLGELVVQGTISPDQFLVFKAGIDSVRCPIVERKRGSKRERLIYARAGGVEAVPVPVDEQRQLSLSDDEVLTLARWGVRIEEHYGTPMDIEWAKDGVSGELYIVQARPETVHAQAKGHELETWLINPPGEALITGDAIGSKIVQGRAQVILDVAGIEQFKAGNILVTDMTDPNWEPVMRIAAGLITNRGGRTSHAAIVSRELGLPAVIGTERGTEIIHDGTDITIDCSTGVGRIFAGRIPFEVNRCDLNHLPVTRTRVMLNVGLPEQAFLQAQVPNDGVGLARQEFIIGSHIGIHPLALIGYEELTARAATEPPIGEIVREIELRSHHAADKRAFFVDTLATGIARIGAAFWPHDVIVRLSDFKSNEYRGLVGGALFEPDEPNPMIGWRGAVRYYDPRFRQAFALECAALARVRGEMGLTNIKVMVPFCRTVEEGRRVIAILREHGLRQGEQGLEVYVMCEVPSNVILARQFAGIFDGFSIGSNDLTQLTLGLDRDSELVSHLYDERNEAVKSLIREVITVARAAGRKIGICGQAPSDFPDFAEFLVECGIDTISLTPDTALKTRLRIAAAEARLSLAGSVERQTGRSAGIDGPLITSPIAGPSSRHYAPERLKP